MTSQTNSLAKPVKEKLAIPFGVDHRWWYVLVAVVFGVVFASLVIKSAAETVSRVIDTSANAVAESANSVAQAMGEIVPIGIAQVLVAGEDQQRIEMLKQMAELETGSKIPGYLLDGIEFNLDHENSEVQMAAEKAWDTLKDLERIESRITIVDGNLFHDGKAMPIIAETSPPSS